MLVKRLNDAELEARARARLIEAKVGLISPEALVAWADEEIARSSDPPFFLIALSMADAGQLRDRGRLDLVARPPDEVDARILASRLLELLEAGRISLDGFETVVVGCATAFPVDTAGWQSFDWISDELDLVRAGVKDKTKSVVEIKRVLAGLAASKPE